MQVCGCVVFVPLPISTRKQKINHSKACNPLHADYKKCLSTDVQFTFMQSYTAPGGGGDSKSHLTEEMVSLAWLQRVNADGRLEELPHSVPFTVA